MNQLDPYVSSKELENFLIAFPAIDKSLHDSAWEGMYQRHHNNENFLYAYENGEEELSPELYDELLELKHDLAQYKYRECEDLSDLESNQVFGIEKKILHTELKKYFENS